MSQSSTSLIPPLCSLAVALLLLTALQTAAAFNVFDFRHESFYQALNHDRYLHEPKGLRGARKTLIFDKDLFMIDGNGRAGRHLIARMDYEGDYNGPGEANDDNSGTDIPIAPSSI